MIETHVRRGNGVRMKKLLMTVAFCAVAGSVPGAVKNVTEDVKLTADADWRGQGVVRIADGVTIDLDYHELKTDGFTADEFELVDATDADRTAHPVTGSPLASGILIMVK